MSKLSFEQERGIVEAYTNSKRDDKIMKELSVRHECSESTLYKILKKHAVVCRGRNLTPEEEKAILQCYSQTSSLVETASKLGHGRNSVCFVLKKHDVSTSKKLFSSEEEIRIIKTYNGGCSLSGVVKIIGKGSKYSVREVLVRHNVEVRSSVKKPKDLSKSQSQQVLKLYKQGMSRNKIANSIDLSRHLVGRVLRHNRIDSRLEKRYSKHCKRGGRISHLGYVMIRLVEDDPLYCMTNQSGYVFEHRFIVAKTIGRPLKQNETVHHKNGIKEDNRIGNLQLRSKAHGPGQAYKCNCCGSMDVSPVDL